jgi:hypothetical protein
MSTIIQERVEALASRKPGGQPTTAESFWARVDKSGDCWPWKGHTDENGYGRVGYREKSNVGAHRVAFALANNGGDLPDAWVLHHCDNPPCVRPDHLFLGDALTNNRDRQDKGRTRGWAGRSGPDHHATKVTPTIAEQMRALRADGFTQQTIADRFGISRGRVAHIVSGVLPPYTKGQNR